MFVSDKRDKFSLHQYTRRTTFMSDPNATHRISRAELFKDDEEEEETPDPNATARISRADLFKDDEEDTSE